MIEKPSKSWGGSRPGSGRKKIVKQPIEKALVEEMERRGLKIDQAVNAALREYLFPSKEDLQ